MTLKSTIITKLFATITKREPRLSLEKSRHLKATTTNNQKIVYNISGQGYHSIEIYRHTHT